MLGESASLALKMRNDMKSLGADNVKEGIINHGHLKSIERKGSDLYPHEKMIPLIHDSTYAPLMMI